MIIDRLIKILLLLALLLNPCVFFANDKKRSVILHYADLAQAMYEDSLTEAIKLRKEIRKLIADPSEQRLKAARQAWVAARIPYSQSEVFRFGNPVVDDWEGKVNAWPLDESLIDYTLTQGSANQGGSNYNIVASTAIEVADREINTLELSKDLLESLHELNDIETNITTGYHAIEFLLWGQDLNGTGSGAGQRPATDFDLKNCEVGHCFKRGKYLQIVADLLIKDLTWMSKQWEVSGQEAKYTLTQGNDYFVFDVSDARAELIDLDVNQALGRLLRGAGSLSYGELAGERMKLGLLLNDPEEEQDCFSDNTHWSLYYNLVGVQNIIYGRYKRIDGRIITGSSIMDLIKDEELKKNINLAFRLAEQSMLKIVNSAKLNNIYYDQLLDKNNVEGHQIINAAIADLLLITQRLNEIVTHLKLADVVFEGSASLDSEDEFFH